MDFLVFKTNHDLDYAINIADLVAIVNPGPIARVPGTYPAVVGMTKFHDELIAVIDTHVLFHGEPRDAPLMMVMQSKQKYGVLIQSVSNIHRGEVPDDVRFIDPHDYEKSVLGFDKEAVRVELF